MSYRFGPPRTGHRRALADFLLAMPRDSARARGTAGQAPAMGQVGAVRHHAPRPLPPPINAPDVTYTTKRLLSQGQTRKIKHTL